MTIYLVSTGFSANTLERISLLATACQQRGICCVHLESTTADRLELPTLKAGDALYNVTRDGIRFEESLWQSGVVTFYADNLKPRGIQDTTRWGSEHTRSGLLQPRTIAHATCDRALLGRYAQMLGGFPLVVKLANSTLGNGVIRTDSLAALLSLTDHLVAEGTDFVLREYIEGSGSGRLMVIGDRVVGSLEYDKPPGDFRTNAYPESHPRLTRFGIEAEALAVAAAHSVGVELGGVDIMFGVDRRCYLLEMNIPCGFATFPRLGVDVPGMMVEHLVTKSELLRNG